MWGWTTREFLLKQESRVRVVRAILAWTLLESLVLTLRYCLVEATWSYHSYRFHIFLLVSSIVALSLFPCLRLVLSVALTMVLVRERSRGDSLSVWIQGTTALPSDLVAVTTGWW